MRIDFQDVVAGVSWIVAYGGVECGRWAAGKERDVARFLFASARRQTGGNLANEQMKP